MENEQEIEKVDSVFIEKKSFVKKVFSGIGVGGAVIGGGLLFLIFTVLRFLYIAFAGLSMVWLAIVLFQKGSIILGLVALIIGTPIALAIASYLFLPLLFISILTLIIWGVVSVFGIHTSFNNIWGWVWFAGKVLLLGLMVFLGISGFISSIKQKRIKEFLRENWFYFPLFLFLFWLFFFGFNKNSTEVSQPDLNQVNQEKTLNPFESMNAYELSKLSTVFVKEEPLVNSDLENMRDALKSYTVRTGNFLTKNDIDAFVEIINESQNYEYELGQSLLFSWDQHKIFTTNAFDGLYTKMQQDSLRKPELLQLEKNRLKQASENKDYSEDAEGNKYEFSREIILQGIDKANIAKGNLNKIVTVFNEFVR